MRTILLATIGTLGDLHPFIALAKGLQAQGFRAVLAIPEDHVAKAHAVGLEAHAVLPSFATVAQRMGMSPADATRRIMSDQRQMLEQVILPDLCSCTTRLHALATETGAEAIVASAFFLAAPIVAEKRGLPLVSVILQPMAMLSAFDPPSTPDFWMMKRAPVGAVGAVWNRRMYGAIRQVLDRIYGKQINVVRRGHGVALTGAARMFDAGAAVVLTLGCYSEHFARRPADAPAIATVTGFPIFDAGDDASHALDPALEAFLAEGPPPLVFTLGSLAVRAAGGFYEVAAKVARRLECRAVLLTGGAPAPLTDDSVFTCSYAPHSALFPHARAIIHHGGIGTTGQALRAGKPQLVVPHMGDQNDHSARIAQIGVGRRISPRRFTVNRVTPLLADMLADDAMQAEAARRGVAIMAEDGALAAADAIVATLNARRLLSQRAA